METSWSGLQDFVVAQLDAAERKLAESHRETAGLLAARFAALELKEESRMQHEQSENRLLRARIVMLEEAGSLSVSQPSQLGEVSPQRPPGPERSVIKPAHWMKGVPEVGDVASAARLGGESPAAAAAEAADEDGTTLEAAEGVPMQPRQQEFFSKSADPRPFLHASQASVSASKGDDPPVRPDDVATATGHRREPCLGQVSGGRRQVSLDVQEAIHEQQLTSTSVAVGNPGQKGVLQSMVATMHSQGHIITNEDSRQSTNVAQPNAGSDDSKAVSKIPVWIVHPHSDCRSLWDMLGLTLVLYDMFSIPFMFFNPPEEGVLTAMVWITRIFWSADMPASLVTGFVQTDGNIEMQPRRILVKYLQSWFVLDAFVVGIDWVELLLRGFFMQFAGFGRASRVIRVLRMLRLLRLVRMREVVATFTERVNSDSVKVFVDIIKILAAIMALAHIIACVWYLVSETIGGENTWLVDYGYDVESGATLGERYSMSFHWSLSQFAGGMDEVTPRNRDERVCAIIVFIITFMMAAAFISSLTSSMTQLYFITSKQTQQYAILRRYLAQGGIPERLAIRVRRNAQHALEEYQRNMSEDAVEMLRFVSDPLRMEIHFELYREDISVHPFFYRFIKEGSQVMRRVCHLAIQFSIVASGDIIFNSGESPSRPKMYFVNRGDLLYTFCTGKETMVGVGQWLAEAALWTTWAHLGVLMAKSDCRLCLLDAQTFRQVVGQFEVPGVDMDAYKEDFLARLETWGSDASDLPFPSEEGDGHDRPRKTSRMRWSL